MSIKDLHVDLDKHGAMAVDAGSSDDTMSAMGAGGFSKIEEARLLRKLDWSLLPCLAMM